MTQPLGEYQYSPLQGSEIRLIHLRPGLRYEEIRFSISHVTLDRPAEQPRVRLSKKQLARTLPDGWEVYETPEGRFLFCYDPDNESGDGQDFQTTWIHPDPNIPSRQYLLEDYGAIWSRKPSFEALSYVWGDPNDRPTVTIVGADGNPIASMNVTKNLAAALRHMRLESETRSLWTDAICINQKDNAEKSVQVKRMGDIYTLATRVVVWLGAEDDDSSLAMSTLSHLGSQVETTLDGFRMTSPGAEEPTWYDMDVDLPYDNKTWEAIVALCDRPWFTRVWTVQEILLANRLAVMVCGQHTITWALFRRAIECILDKQSIPRGREILNLARTAIINGPDRPLGQILSRHTHRGCFMPHDKVYGMLAMTPAKFAAATTVDYDQPVEELYKTTFLTNSLLIKRWELFGCDTIDRGITAPSWVPDFKEQSTNGIKSLGQLSAGISELHLTYESPDILKVLGVRFTTVAWVAEFAPDHPKLTSKALPSWIPDDIDTGTYPGGLDLKDVYAATLIQDDLRERCPDEEGWPNLKEWRRYCQNRLFDHQSRQKFRLNRANYLDDMLYRRCQGRLLMRLENGSIGLGPKGTKPGDVVCVVLGCDQPLVLRETSKPQFHFVGNCFVHDLRDAQLLLGPLPPSWRLQVIDHSEQEYRRVYRYLNTQTGELTAEDPRLEATSDWERVELEDLGRDLNGDDPEMCDFFKNKVTGELVSSDPRLMPESLRARGVMVEQFSIA